MIKTASDDLQNKNQGSPLRLLEAMAVGPNDDLEEKNVLEPNVKVYICTKSNAEVGSSKVVTGQLPVVNEIVVLLIINLCTLLYIMCMLIAWIDM